MRDSAKSSENTLMQKGHGGMKRAALGDVTNRQMHPVDAKAHVRIFWCPEHKFTEL